MNTKKLQCNVCGNKNLIERITSNANVLLVECKTCGLIAKVKLERWEDNFTHGDQNLSEFISNYNNGEIWRRKVALQRLNLLKIFKPSGRILDFGCATGFFLDEASRLGYQATGIECNEMFLCLAKKMFPAIHFYRHILSGHYKSTFDIITIFDSIGYLENIAEFFQDVNVMLKKDGLFFVSTLLPDACIEEEPSILSFNYYLTPDFMQKALTRFKLNLEKYWNEPKNINTIEPYSKKWWKLKLGIQKQIKMSYYVFTKT